MDLHQNIDLYLPCCLKALWQACTQPSNAADKFDRENSIWKNHRKNIGHSADNLWFIRALERVSNYTSGCKLSVVVSDCNINSKASQITTFICNEANSAVKWSVFSSIRTFCGRHIWKPPLDDRLRTKLAPRVEERGIGWEEWVTDWLGKKGEKQISSL